MQGWRMQGWRCKDGGCKDEDARMEDAYKLAVCNITNSECNCCSLSQDVASAASSCFSYLHARNVTKHSF